MIRPLRLLRWLYLGRTTLAVGIFVAALLVWSSMEPMTTLVITLAFLSAVIVTAAGFWYTHLRRREPGRNFLYAQVLFDTILVTGVVHLTGGSQSDFAPLYILVIVAGALLLPLPGGVLIGILASLLYFTDIVWLHDAIPPATVFVQIGLFTMIALVTGVLGDRLRQAGTALGAVESELRQLRLETGDILDAIDTGVITVDPEGRAVYMNRAAGTLLAFSKAHPDGESGQEAAEPSPGVPEPVSPADWSGRPVLDELDRRAPGLGAQLRHSLTTGLPVRWYETRAAGWGEGPGSMTGGRTIGVRTTVVERERGGVAWATAVFQDITDGKRLEELNRRAARLQAVAELAASLAHEIRNPLASIRSGVEQVTDSRLEAQDHDTLRRLVQVESDRLSRLLSEFIEFSRVRLRNRSTVELDALTAEAIELVRHHPAGEPAVQVEYSSSSQPVEVEGDGDLLHRLVFNLVLNAVQNARPDGRVHVEVEPVGRAERPVGVPFDSSVRITVSDSGPGVPAEDMPRIFDPFFTTREGGTGLGLAVVHRAVDEHHGAIFVDREPGRGARFSVYLPNSCPVS